MAGFGDSSRHWIADGAEAKKGSFHLVICERRAAGRELEQG
jgi:hypothetical protein